MTFAAPLEAKSIRFRARSFVAFTLTPEAPMVEWLQGLDHWIGNSPGYFAGRPVLLDLNSLKPAPSEIAALVAELGTRGIRIYAIELEGASLGPDLPPLLVGAKEATTEGLLPGRKGGQEGSGKPDGKAAEGRAPDHGVDAGGVAKSKAGASKTEESEPQVSHYDSGTLMIKAPIRSGQAIMHAHGDVIVLGSVASGSEIVAAGSIHVYGTLRGRASAGALGNTAARIFCRRNEAELLSVDGWYITAEEMEGVSRGKPVQAFLDGDGLRVETLS
ncbi:septum site-determining protein MinC [Mesorhizobium loti NZP2037]|nr:septum site-determining protein MinC [Mesorhizobium loti]ANN58262.1 septum site-determining protein MinC [Mesorhizobium loti NZP2037]